jgi:putative Mn2+ efflux pump MntP
MTIKFLWEFILLFFLALTMSVDDFSVGVAYGLFKIKIPIKTLLITVLGSATSTWTVMLIGHYIFTNMPTYITGWASAIVLWCVGCKMLYNGFKKKDDSIEFAKKHPLDTQGSHSVNAWETYIVGIGLGVDDFAQAVGLALAGFPIVLTVILLEVGEMIALLSGNFLAFKGFSKKVSGKLVIIPGILLILIGFYEIFF